MKGQRACDRCLRRTWLLERLAGHIDVARARIGPVLELDSRDLLSAMTGRHRRVVEGELASLDPDSLRRRARSAGLELLCRCDAAYPERLTALRGPPAVLHIAGGLERFLELVDGDPVAIVGARHASAYGVESARSLGGALAAAGVSVVSGMALGIDSAAHAGALAVGGGTVAVLAGGADRPYPASKRSLHAQIIRTGAAVSELPSGTAVRRWMFPARNRIIAALSAMTVVVEAGAGSGALLTAGFARELGRPVGAVPGRISSPLAAGPHELLATGAQLIRGPQDVLDGLFGAGIRAAPRDARPELPSELRALLAAIGDGHDTAASLSRAGLRAEDGLAALAALELSGHVRREAGGRYTVVS